MSEYRRICMYCKTDMGPAGTNFTGDTHGTCSVCFSIQMAKIDALETTNGNGWGGYTLEDEMNYRPAGKSNICDAYELNPDYGIVVGGSRLIRCRCHATHRITIQTAAEVAALKRCPRHAAELLARKKAGATFEILSNESLVQECAA